MTAQKTLTVMALTVLLAAGLVSAWSFARAGDPYSLAAAIFSALASVMAVVILRRPGVPYPGPLNPAQAARVIAKFVGFAAACWLLIFVRVRVEPSSLLEPLNVLVLLASLCSLVIGLQFTLLLRDSRRTRRGFPGESP